MTEAKCDIESTDFRYVSNVTERFQFLDILIMDFATLNFWPR